MQEALQILCVLEAIVMLVEAVIIAVLVCVLPFMAHLVMKCRKDIDSLDDVVTELMRVAGLREDARKD